MLDLLATEPCLSVVPLAKRNASARLVLPAPAGPTSAINLVPLDIPGMRLSFLRCWRGRRVACRAAGALQRSSVGLFAGEGNSLVITRPSLRGANATKQSRLSLDCFATLATTKGV